MEYQVSLTSVVDQLIRFDDSDSSASDRTYIHELPSELLDLVFKLTVQPKIERFKLAEAVLPSFNLTALALSHTCAQWRAIALDTPTLWSIIDINTPPTQQTLNLLQLYLFHSGETGFLDISLSDSPTRDANPAHIKRRYGSGSLVAEEEFMREIFDILIAQMHRWKYINFYLDRTPPLFRFFTIAFTDLTNIESMSIKFDCCPGAFGRSGGWWDGAVPSVWEKIHKAPTLREVHWQSHDMLSSAPFQQLTKISLMTIGLGQLWQHLPSCERLEHLEIDRLLAPHESMAERLPDPIRLRHLHTLIVHLISVEASQLLDLLILPKLQELYLRHGTPIENIGALEGLLARSSSSTIKPTLVKFSLIDRESPERDVLASLNQAMPYFKNVKICLFKFRGISERTIHSFMPQYIPSPLARNSGDVVLPFPSLEDLTLIGCFIKEDGLIGRMVTTRQLLNCPLFVLEVELKGACFPWFVLKRDEWVLKKLIEDDCDEGWRIRGRLGKLDWRVR